MRDLLHRHKIAGGFAGSGRNVPIRKLIVNQIAGGAGLLGSDVVDQNLRVAQLANFVVADGLVAKQCRDVVERLIRFLADRLPAPAPAESGACRPANPGPA